MTYTSELAHRRSGTPLGEPVHPVQLYEMGAELLIACFLIWWLLKRNRYAGEVGLLYFILYGILRFGLEMLREDHRGGFWIFSTSQVIALAILSFAVPAFVYGLKKGSPFSLLARLKKG